MPVCVKCLVESPVEGFHKDARKSSGYRSTCKACISKQGKRYRAENTHAIKERLQAWQEANRDKARLASNAWKANNVDHVRQYHKAWAQRQVVLRRASIQRRRATQQANGVFCVTAKELNRLYSSPCFYCGSNASIQLDHVIPISRGGRHSIGNLVAACSTCNASKKDKLITEWRKTNA